MNIEECTFELQRLDSHHHLHPFTDPKVILKDGARVITRADGPPATCDSCSGVFPLLFLTPLLWGGEGGATPTVSPGCTIREQEVG